MNVVWRLGVVLVVCWYAAAKDIDLSSDSYDSDVATINQVISELPSYLPLSRTFSRKHFSNYRPLTNWLRKQHSQWHHLPHGALVALLSRWHHGQHPHNTHSGGNHSKQWLQILGHNAHSGEVHNKQWLQILGHNAHSGEVHNKQWLQGHGHNAHSGEVHNKPTAVVHNRPGIPVFGHINLGGHIPHRPTPTPRSFPSWLAHWKSSEVGDCGIPEVESKLQLLRIMGGSVVKPGSWPWMVSLRNRLLDQDYCAGVLLSREWVITAAHCFTAFLHDTTTWEVRLGKFNVNVTDKTQQDFKIAGLFIHEQFRARPVQSYYHPTTVYNVPEHDVALIKLSRPAHITEWVRPLCLPRPGEVPRPGQKCVIAGWGMTDSKWQCREDDGLKTEIGVKMSYRYHWSATPFGVTYSATHIII